MPEAYGPLKSCLSGLASASLVRWEEHENT